MKIRGKNGLHRDTKKGMTLIEVLIAMSIIGLLGLGIVSLQYILNKNQVLVINSYKSVDEANSVITSFAREIRGARNSDNGAYLLVRTNDQEITFFSDIDYDGATERVRYTLSGTDLIKGIIEPTDYPVQYPSDQETTTTLTSNVRNGANPVFYYYNAGWPQDVTNNPLAQNKRLSDTRSIKISLMVNTQTDNSQSDYALESLSQIRMLKDNL